MGIKGKKSKAAENIQPIYIYTDSDLSGNPPRIYSDAWRLNGIDFVRDSFKLCQSTPTQVHLASSLRYSSLREFVEPEGGVSMLRYSSLREVFQG